MIDQSIVDTMTTMFDNCGDSGDVVNKAILIVKLFRWAWSWNILLLTLTINPKQPSKWYGVTTLYGDRQVEDRKGEVVLRWIEGCQGGEWLMYMR